MTATNSNLELVSTSPAETLAIAQRLASLLRPGDVVLLVGQLGAGKTLFACGVAEGLGVSERVTSPTFVIAKRYAGLMPVHHADIYRIGSTAEFDDLDLVGAAADGVLLIEWGDAIAHLVPIDHLVIKIEQGEDDDTRTITVHPEGAWRDRRLTGLA